MRRYPHSSNWTPSTLASRAASPATGKVVRNEQRLLPRIAGKPAGYLYNQLVAFRDGTRRYPPMNYLVAYLPDDYLCEIAEHFSRQSPPLAARDLAPAADAQLQRGQQLVTVGDPGRGVPACAACHGARLTGMIPGIPGLIGLRPTYIAAQLTRWRVGSGTPRTPTA